MSALRSFLATTAVPEFWDTTGHVVFIGDRCLRPEHATIWGSLDYEVLPSPWADRERFHRAVGYLDDCAELLLGRLADYLNTVHRQSFSRRYWRVALGNWLLNYLHSAYDRYVQLTDVFRDRPGLRTILLDRSCFRVPTTTEEMINGLKIDDLWNLQLMSQLLTAVGYSFGTRRMNAGDSKRRRRCGVIRTAQRSVQWAAENAVLRLRSGGPDAVLCGMDIMDTAAVWRLAAASGFQFVPVGPRSPGGPFRAVFDERRVGVSALDADDPFQRAAVMCLPWYLPTVFLEGYEATRQRALAGWHRMPRVIVSATGWNSDETFKLFAAEACDQGSRLVAVQHGGGYGVARAWPSEDVERRLSDVFIAWGWAGTSGRNLPHPNFSRHMVRRRHVGDDVLFVATGIKRYVTRFNSSPLGTLDDEYFNGHMRFLGSVAEDVRPRVRFRPYPGAVHPLRQRIKAAYREVRWEEGPSFSRSLATARVVVIDHPVTSMLEALVADVPTILFWDERYWELRCSAAPYFDALRAAGILHPTPEAAAACLNGVLGRVHQWWRSEAVQQARRAFVQRFVSIDARWTEAWLAGIGAEVARAEDRDTVTSRSA